MGARMKCSLRCRKGKRHQEWLCCDQKMACQLCKTFICFFFGVLCVCPCGVCAWVYAHLHMSVHMHGGPSLTLVLFLYCFLPCMLKQTLPELKTHHRARLVSHLTLGIPVSASGELGSQEGYHTSGIYMGPGDPNSAHHALSAASLYLVVLVEFISSFLTPSLSSFFPSFLSR